MTKEMTWAQEYRINWIAEMLHVYGYVNRQHIMRKFRLSTPQASTDFKLFGQHFPHTAVYDKVTKRYLPKVTQA